MLPFKQNEKDNTKPSLVLPSFLLYFFNSNPFVQLGQKAVLGVPPLIWDTLPVPGVPR